jgi:hypothetical protein
MVGFVYLITCTENGKQYIGKKLANFSKTKYKVVKLKNGNKKRKKIKELVESDWMSYWSSSEDVKSNVIKYGEDKFTREILYFAETKGDLSYLEAREQFIRRVLENPDSWYNGIIQCRIHRRHLSKNVPTPHIL